MSENTNNAMLGAYGRDIKEIIKSVLEFMRNYGSSLDKHTAAYSVIETTPDGELYLKCKSGDRYVIRRTIFKNSACANFSSKVRVWLAGAIKGMAKLEGYGGDYRKQSIAASKAWSRTNDEKTARFEFTFAQAYAVYDILMDRKTKTDRYSESAKAIISAGPNDPVLTELETYRRAELAKAKADMDSALKAAGSDREKITKDAWAKYWDNEKRINDDYTARIENINKEIDAALAELTNAASGGSQPAVAA